MRARLLVVVSVLMVAVVLGLGVPLAAARAATASSDMFTDRLGDTTRFAALAQRPVTDADDLSTAALGGELARYDELFGVRAVVLDRQGEVLVASRPDVLAGTDPDDDARVALALAGRRSPTHGVIWPWDPRPMLLAEPVLVGGEVRGAAVTISPTGALRADVLVAWGALALVGAAALAVAAVLAVYPTVRWILAPVEELDAGTARVAAAVRAGRPAEPVGDGRGPPELRRLARDFDAMAASVTATLEAQRSFVADASHQLRNPLTALRLRLATLAEDLDGTDAVPPEVRDGPGAALEEIDRLAAVLEALLALARTEGRAVAPVEMRVDPVLDERLETWSVLAGHEGLSLHRAGPRGLVVHSDPVTVATVLDAVLDNAVTYSPPGTAVELTTARVEGVVEIAVRDHGPGLAPEELDHATERFWRGGLGPDGGTGLGLAIAARGAERAGADLSLELPEDGGLRVVMRWAGSS